MKTILIWWRKRHPKPSVFARALAVHVLNATHHGALT